MRARTPFTMDGVGKVAQVGCFATILRSTPVHGNIPVCVGQEEDESC